MLIKEPKVSVSQNTTRICAILPQLSTSFSTVEDKAIDLGFFIKSFYLNRVTPQ